MFPGLRGHKERRQPPVRRAGDAIRPAYSAVATLPLPAALLASVEVRERWFIAACSFGTLNEVLWRTPLRAILRDIALYR